MFTTVVRLLARQGSRDVPRSRSSLRGKQPVDPKVPLEEAFRLSGLLHNILNRHGPLTVSSCWDHAQDEGFKSKKHMKVMLRWMKERHRVKVIGSFKNKKTSDEDSCRYATLFYNEATEKP